MTLDLGRIGAWFNPQYDDDTRRRFVVEAEALGYPTAGSAPVAAHGASLNSSKRCSMTR